VTNTALKLGVSFLPWKRWTENELDFLCENAGDISLKKLAKHLKRSPDSVKHQIYRMELSAEVSKGYSVRQLVQLLGSHHGRIQTWIGKGWLRMEQGRVTERSLQGFLFAHMEEYSFRKCDEPWLKGMLNPSFGIRSIVRTQANEDRAESLEELEV
jgi:hypothetical protein